VIEIADENAIPVITPREPQLRAGIVTLAPEPQDAAPLAAALANAGVTITPRGGTIRVSTHAGTDDESLLLFASALSAYVASRAW
jgi:hypothetical protein